MKRWYHIVIALVVLIGIGVFLNEDLKKEQQEENQKEADETLVKMDWLAPDSFEIQTKEVVVHFKVAEAKAQQATPADEKNWSMVAPLQTPTDSSEVQNFLRTIKNIKYTRVIAEDAEDLSVYGLDETSQPLVFKISQGDQLLKTLAIGISNPAQDANYATLDGSSKVYLIEKRLDYLANKDLLYFRDKQIFAANNNEVKRIEIAWKDREDTLILKQGGHWQLQQPIKVFADDENVSNFLTGLRNLRVDKFVSDDANKDTAKYGLGKPTAEIRVTYVENTEPVTEPEANETPPDSGKQEPKEPQFIFQLADLDPKNTTFYGKVVGGSSIYEIKKFHLTKLDNAYTYFVDRELGNFIAEAIDKIEVSGAEAQVPYVLKRDANNVWAFQTKEGRFPANGRGVDEMIIELNSFKANQFLGMPDMAKKLGLQPEDLRITLSFKQSDADGGKTKTVEYALKRNKLGGKYRYLAKGGRDQLIYKVDNSVYDKVLKQHRNMLQQALVPEGTVITRLKLSHGDKSIDATRSGESWTVNKSEGFKVTAEQILQLTELIRNEKLENVVAISDEPESADWVIELMARSTDENIDTTVSTKISLKQSNGSDRVMAILSDYADFAPFRGDLSENLLKDFSKILDASNEAPKSE